MKVLTIVTILFFGSSCLFATELPKNCYGVYKGEVGSYSIVKNEKEITIASHEIELDISPEWLVYRAGNISFTGKYDIESESNGEYVIVAFLKSNKMETQIEVQVNKKGKIANVHGTEGRPDVALSKVN